MLKICVTRGRWLKIMENRDWRFKQLAADLS